jgi:hypothetical protein
MASIAPESALARTLARCPDHGAIDLALMLSRPEAR